MKTVEISCYMFEFRSSFQRFRERIKKKTSERKTKQKIMRKKDKNAKVVYMHTYTYINQITQMNNCLLITLYSECNNTVVPSKEKPHIH